jgi:hypothetical protein
MVGVQECVPPMLGLAVLDLIIGLQGYAVDDFGVVDCANLHDYLRT